MDGTEFAQLAMVVATELAERLDVRIEIISAVAREEDVPVRYRELANDPCRSRAIYLGRGRSRPPGCNP